MGGDRCACESTGWQPLHLTCQDSEESPLQALCLLYAKYDSMGEFIFDHSWAAYATLALGIQYYPKVIVEYLD